MFKRHAAGHQRIFPSEPAAPSMAPAPAPMTTSDSISADLGYLHHVSDEEREAYANGCATATNSVSRRRRDSAPWAICSAD